MEAAVLNAPMNATQLFVLQTFARARSEQERDDQRKIGRYVKLSP